MTVKKIKSRWTSQGYRYQYVRRKRKTGGSRLTIKATKISIFKRRK